MTTHRDASAAPSGSGQLRRAEQISGFATLGLALAVSTLSLVMGDPVIPMWIWAGTLVVWCSAVAMSTNPLLGSTVQLAFYGCAVLAAWALVLTASSNDLMMIVLILVAAIGPQQIPMRWVMVLSVLNCLLIFGIQLNRRPDLLLDAIVFSAFYLIIHAATVFSVHALVRESHLRAELEQKNLELEATSVLLEDSVVATERLRISRELHDVLGHHLTVLNLDLEVAKLHSNQATREHIDRAGGVAKHLLTSLRSNVGQLRDDPPGDLQHSLQRLADAVSSLEIHIKVDPEVPTDEETTATLVRTAQEIITNTLKHAEATRLFLDVALEHGAVSLTGINDGAAPRKVTPGHGLTGLRERLELLGGQLSISSSPEFTVTAQLPSSHDQQVQT